MSAAENAPELAPLKRACHITGQSKTYIYAHLEHATNPFPKPIRIGSRVYWVVAELHAWNQQQIDRARGAAA